MNYPAYDLEGALKQFDLKSFRPGQREVISSIVNGDDCLCIMPTGGGKSLCYQLPSVIRPGLTIVVSPLIALMKDQVDSLGQRGIPAALINSTLSLGEQQDRLVELAAGKYQLVYVAPERLRNNRFLEAIRATPIQLLAIDEAHCISQWGHDFRPDYAKLGKFREWLGNVQTVALTATATPRVRQDIVEVLRLTRPKQFMSGFARPNLHFGVVQRSSDREKDEELENFLKTQQGSGIIYAATRKRCEALVEWIGKRLSMSVGVYHAGLLPDQRRAVQERFMRNELRVIVATNAFGMGIDKPDLRFVIHYNMPGSIEAYYQEAGRAGRDGADSQCVLLYSYQDRYIQEFFIDNNYPPREIIQTIYDFLLTREEDPIELTHDEIKEQLGLSVSGEAIGSSLQILARTGVMDRLETGGGLAAVQIDSDLPTLVDMLPREAKVQRKVMRIVELAVGDRRGELVYIHPRYLLQRSELDRDALARALRELTKLSVFDYIPPFRGRAVHFKRRDLAFDDLGIDFENLRKRKDAEYERLNQVVRYSQSPLCRQATILQYFGDPSACSCKQCDRCCGQPGWPTFAVVSPPVAPPVKSQEKAPSPPADNPIGLTIDNRQQTAFLLDVVEAIERIHGRLGKILIAQYLCGSQNAKIQKLRLHRLSSFGMLKGARQADVIALIECLLAAGILQQTEVNRNRPTVAVSDVLKDVKQRYELVSNVQLATKLQTTFASRILQRNPAKAIHSSTNEPASGSPPIVAVSAHLQFPDSNELPSQVQSSPTRSSGQELPKPIPTVRNQVPAPHVESQKSVSGPITKAEPITKVPRSAEQPETAPPATSEGSDTAPDWKWSVKLLESGFTWTDVMTIRRMSDIDLARSMLAAIESGFVMPSAWLNNEHGRTSGQQRLHRELQRRSAAGI